MNKNLPPLTLNHEVELKLALPTTDPLTLARRLAQTPVLARRKPSVQQLHNVYFDTPEQFLHQERVALRLRRLGSAAQPQWVQTLKTGGRSDSALSQRGEWESAVAGAQLDWPALQATPWAAQDPKGALFKTLAPRFTTDFERTCWLVRRRDGSQVEVVLDLGQVLTDGKSSPICELELELKAGPVSALFDVARQISQSVAVLPASQSKAERGYALALHTQAQAQCALPPKLAPKQALAQAAQQVLCEMFGQFTANLNALCSADAPELVHQARVGWRRFKSALHLFRPVLVAQALPSLEPLQALLSCLGALRDLDVAQAETLPPLAALYTAGDARREQTWQAMNQSLAQAGELQRKAVRYALQEPSVGSCLLAITQWLETLTLTDGPQAAVLPPKESLKQWARQRVVRLHAQLQQAQAEAHDPASWHQVRIRAKRLRYGMEALNLLLPKRQRRHWYALAHGWQTSLGAAQDRGQALVLLARLEVDRGLVEFLRGVSVGQSLAHELD